MKTAHILTGQSATISGRGDVAFYVDFTGAVGTATLQAKIDGDWLPVSETYSATTALVLAATFLYGMELRWNVVRTSGTITTYLN